MTNRISKITLVRRLLTKDEVREEIVTAEISRGRFGNNVAGKRARGALKKRIPITREMIQRSFEEESLIKSRLLGWVVYTPSGGIVRVRQKSIVPIRAGEAEYASITALGGEAWGVIKPNGSINSQSAFLAHGANQGILVEPRIVDPTALRRRIGLSLFLYAACWALGYYYFDLDNNLEYLIGIVPSLLLYWNMSRLAKKAEVAWGQELRDIHPTLQGERQRREHEWSKEDQ